MSKHIKNSMEALEIAIKEIENALRIFSEVQTGLTTELDVLHKSGFSDSKFEELRVVLSADSEKIKISEKEIRKFIDELGNRAKLIRAYYEIAI